MKLFSGEAEAPYPSAPLEHKYSRRTRSKYRALVALAVVSVVWGILAWNRQHRGRPFYGKHAENVFLAVPDERSAVQASRNYATRPHLAGSSEDFDTALDFLKLLQTELGIPSPSAPPVFSAGSQESRDATLSIAKRRGPTAWIDTYYPMLNTPLDRSVQIVDDDGAVLWNANLEETSDDTDADAEKYSDAVPAFHGLSHGGDVTGNIVDGNYCSQKDFNNMTSRHISLEGAIVMCRYGGLFRGLKVKGAAELGAAGVLIYSDPRDDGTVTVENGYKAYPHGPARNPTSVQRGSVQYLSIYPGDPTTPGYPSYESSPRTEGFNIPPIPSIPVSWENAEQLLKTLQEGSFKGKRVRMVNNVDTKVTPIWNTMGIIPGHIRNEVVVVGNHRDAWVLGAGDPSSGTASMHETIRGLGLLLRKGWRPLRTILIASWDAEEYGLIGSTEWGEDFTEWMKDHVVAYINLDTAVSGSRLRFSASPLLAHFIRDVALEIRHPTKPGHSLWDARGDNGTLLGPQGHCVISAAIDREVLGSVPDNVGVNPLGSGSDHTVFVQLSGIPSAQGGFASTRLDPVYHYHSVFDSERWQEIYGDPGFFRHVAVAKLVGLQALRLSSSLILPYNTTHYALELESYLDRVEALTTNLSFPALRESILFLQFASAKLDSEKDEALKELIHAIKEWNKHQRSISQKICRLMCRIKKLLGMDCNCHNDEDRAAVEDNVPDSWFKAAYVENHDSEPRLQEETERSIEDDAIYGIAVQAGFTGPHWIFSQIASHMDSDAVLEPWRSLLELRHAIKRVLAVNKKLSHFEHGFISKDGIKGREWYKHLVVAPGMWEGYGATTFPGLSEAIVYEKSSKRAHEEAARVEALIRDLVELISVGINLLT